MLISDFKKIIRKWPAYEKFIERSGVNIASIQSLNDLPVTDKQFMSTAIHSIPLLKVRNIVPSSGSTGDDFSFGLFGDNDLKKTSHMIDRILKTRFNSLHKKTLLLNMLPGAISLNSSVVSTASIGVRIDTALSVIRSFSSSFDQLILAGEPLFMKDLIESGVKEDILWKHIPLHIVVGGEWTPVHYTTYLETMAGIQRLYSFMGLAELGLNYFFETDETIMFRHLLSEDRSLLRLLFGDLDFCPMIFAYDDQEVFVESIAEPSDALESVILTTLNPHRALPLIRYKSGDKGKVLYRDEINRALAIAGYMPIFIQPGSPILAHFGRGHTISNVYPERIKEILYGDVEVASISTGNFRLCPDDEGIHLKVQLKKGIKPDFSRKQHYRKSFSSIPVKTILYSFEDFPYLLDFERKVRYVCKNYNGSEKRTEKAGISAAV